MTAIPGKSTNALVSALMTIRLVARAVVVSTSGTTLVTDKSKKIGVGPGDREIVVQNRY
jgi:hypothetical protein